jgi:hypothetical protein
MKHTPGPWETSRDATPEWHTQVTVYAEATGKRVATVFETPANARLIAAAPELLEALRWALSVLDKSEEHHPGSIHRMLNDVGEQRWKEARYFAEKAEGR